MEEKKLDMRLVEKFIARKRLDPKELDQALSKLPDDSANAEYISLEELRDIDVK